MSQDVTSARDQWLNQAKRLVKALSRRNGIYTELCPARFELEPDEKDALLAKVSEATKEIAGILSRLAQIEAESSQPVGARALLGHAEIPETTRMLIAILALNRISPTVVESDFRKVGDFQEYCGNRDVSLSLTIRDTFSITGPLRPFLNLGPASVLDECLVQLKESAFAKVLGREPTEEALIRDEAGGSVGRRFR